MKDYKIEYQDEKQNELWISFITAYDLEDATIYANKLMAGTSHNDLTTFEIREL